MMTIHHQSTLILYSIGIFLLLVFSAWVNLRSKNSRTSVGDIWVICLLIIFCTFAFYDTDYFNYLSAFKTIVSGKTKHFEDGYIWLTQYANDYTLFRLAIWGTATIMLYLTIRHLRLNPHQTLFLFVSIFLLKFAYGRVSLAITMIYWGLSLVCMPGTMRISARIIGFTAIGLSFLFHKSAPFGMAIAILSLIPFKKRGIKLSLWLFPLAVIAAQLVVNFFLDMNSVDDSDMVIGHTKHYLSTKVNGRGISAIIRILLERTPYYIAAYIYFRCQVKGMMRKWPYPYLVIANASYITIYISSLFLFDLGVETTVIYYRFLYFTMIPGALFLTYCYVNNYYRKWVSAAVVIGLLGEFYTMAYSYYACLAHS